MNKYTIWFLQQVQNGIVSWKTTLLGVAAGLYPIWNDPTILSDRTRLMHCIVLALIGFFAKDGDKTSEQTGAVLPPSLPVGTAALKSILIACGLCVPILLSGCGATDPAINKGLDGSEARWTNYQKNMTTAVQAQQDTILAQAQAMNTGAVQRDVVRVTAIAKAKNLPAEELSTEIMAIYGDAQNRQNQTNQNLMTFQRTVASYQTDYTAGLALLEAVKMFNNANTGPSATQMAVTLVNTLSPIVTPPPAPQPASVVVPVSELPRSVAEPVPSNVPTPLTSNGNK